MRTIQPEFELSEMPFERYSLDLRMYGDKFSEDDLTSYLQAMAEYQKAVIEWTLAAVNKSMPKEIGELFKDAEVLTNTIAVQNTIVKRLREKAKGRPGREALMDLADKCRFKNGKVNFSALGKNLGVSHHTAKEWCQEARIS